VLPKAPNPTDRLERVVFFLLLVSFLTGVGLLQWRRQQPSFHLEVLSESPTLPVSPVVFSLNHAAEEDLAKLPGVGPKLAKRIVAYRTRQGRFQVLEDLLNVKGIGPALYEKILPYVTLE